jgi:hypothetical protein
MLNLPDMLARFVAWALIVVHVGLGLWAFAGFAELALPQVPWTRLSNPAFSRSMLLLQWSLIGVAAAAFIAGYAWRWRHTPIAMSVIYGAMALVCAYQTLFVLTHPSRFRAMTIEYVEYAVILAFLFLSDHMRQRFA